MDKKYIIWGIRNKKMLILNNKQNTILKVKKKCLKLFFSTLVRELWRNYMCRVIYANRWIHRDADTCMHVVKDLPPMAYIEGGLEGSCPVLTESVISKIFNPCRRNVTAVWFLTMCLFIFVDISFNFLFLH